MGLTYNQRERLDKWAAGIAAIVTGALVFAAYAFATFETKEHADERKADISQRLDRIEIKQDRIETKLDAVLK